MHPQNFAFPCLFLQPLELSTLNVAHSLGPAIVGNIRNSVDENGRRYHEAPEIFGSPICFCNVEASTVSNKFFDVLFTSYCLNLLLTLQAYTVQAYNVSDDWTTQDSIYKNLAIANRSRVSCAHNTSRASIGLITNDLESRSRVTQGHWKRNHWIDHTRLISRVI